FGLFHWLLLVVCGWANASDAVEIMCVSFLLPTARCDLRLSSSDMGILTASIFLMMVGGYMWGYLADQRGRCRVLVVSLSVNGVFGGLASVAPGFWLFLLLRFISGIVGGSIPVIFSYFSEFLPRLRRGAMISALATFWMAGNILAALAWWVIPQNWAHFESWRLFVVLCSVPSLSSALLFKIMMPESPKFLMEFYGLWMWFPELFKRVEDGGSPCANVSRSYSLQNESCYPVKTAYMEGFFIAASNLPGNIFTILMMDSIGGKALLAGSLMLSSLSVFLIFVVQTKAHSLLLSCVFSGVSVISWNALDVMGTELYPTHLSSALGFFTGVGRVAAIMGNVVFGRLLDSHCAVPVLLVSGLLLTGGLIALLLPQTKQTELT
uniref:Major facilitator superfamily (MFS) profile domain-containing protein n=1 Tax=Periophthalmus magnuspinnatus TaxID=409849 RepID=A0A3B4AW36_9GOBI